MTWYVISRQPPGHETTYFAGSTMGGYGMRWLTTVEHAIRWPTRERATRTMHGLRTAYTSIVETEK